MKELDLFQVMELHKSISKLLEDKKLNDEFYIRLYNLEVPLKKLITYLSEH